MKDTAHQPPDQAGPGWFPRLLTQWVGDFSHTGLLPIGISFLSEQELFEGSFSDRSHKVNLVFSRSFQKHFSTLR
jgi:hypothetical protein